MNLVNIEGTAPRTSAREVMTIAASMTVTCALGAALLGGVFLWTNRYQEAARTKAERAAVMEMLGLDASAEVLQVHQYLDAARQQVIYRSQAAAGKTGRELIFTLDGALVKQGAFGGTKDADEGLTPLGRIFVARRGGNLVGFVTEGEAPGYKNRIRFFVAIDADFQVAGVRVIEHEEDPGLGAEIATGWFQGQYAGRTVASLPALDVTRDPMPEDWRSALREKNQMGAAAWQARFASLLARENPKQIYAVTGATISSRALTNGVRTAAHHFARRWELLEPHLVTEKVQ